MHPNKPTTPPPQAEDPFAASRSVSAAAAAFAATFAAKSDARPNSSCTAEASFAGRSDAYMNPFVIRAARHKHGPRSWGKLEYAQAAIAALFPEPRYITRKKLHGDVTAYLANDPAYQTSGLTSGLDEISPRTVKRAEHTLRNANR
jgi:hypothetical protein